MLLRIDENIEIDMSYITCAEYQLFIDEKLKAGKHRQPDHWTSYRLLPGDAKKPIAGVRSSDAEEFCEWLNQQQSAQGFKYRVPTLAEVEEYPVTEKQIGCWCFDGEQRIIAGIETGQKQTWEQKLAEVLDLDRDLYRDLDLYRVLDRDLYLYRDLNRDLNRDLDRLLDRDSDLDRHLNRHLDRDLDRDLNRDLNRDLDRDLDRVLDRVLDPKIKAIEAGEASDFLLLYFPLIFVIFIYHFLSVNYEVISKNKGAINQLNLSRRESEAISRKYLDNLNKIYPLYVYLVLLDERQAGRIPAWESIRIVRERVDR